MRRQFSFQNSRLICNSSNAALVEGTAFFHCQNCRAFATFFRTILNNHLELSKTVMAETMPAGLRMFWPIRQ